jgi:beta-N-acetylhexosaminidase
MIAVLVAVSVGIASPSTAPSAAPRSRRIRPGAGFATTIDVLVTGRVGGSELTSRYGLAVTDAQLSRRQVLAAAAAAAAAGLAACGSPLSAGGAAATPTVTPGANVTGPPAVGPVAVSPSASTSEISLSKKIASLLVVGFRGESVQGGDWIVEAITREGLGGVILFDTDQLTGGRRNVTSPAQVTTLIRTLRAASGGRLIVSIDQEGGQISRLNPGDGFPPSQSQAQIGAANTPATTRVWAHEMAQTLATIGVTFNFAPVVDMDVNRNNPAIGRLGRSFSANPDVVVANAAEAIAEYRAVGVRTSLKHFPGFGSATGNTDFDVVDVSTTWRPTELDPFRRLITAGLVDSVMVAHLLNRQLDPNRPASLSPAVVNDLLRRTLGWRGVVVSDDMQAAAISRRYGQAQAVTMALEAGVDLFVFANQQIYNPKVVEETVSTMEGLVRSGHISEAQIDQSVARVNTIRPSN